MRRLLANRWCKFSAGLMLVVLAVGTACAWHLRIWSSHDLLVYSEMSRECHPVWRDLHAGRIRAGQNVEEVIAVTKPGRVARYGKFVELSFTGVTLVAKDGHLANASAGSCTWDHVFFDEFTPAERTEYADAWVAHLAIGQEGD